MIFFSTVMVIELRDQDQMGASRCSWERRWRTGRRRGQGLKMLQASRALIFLTIEFMASSSLIFSTLNVWPGPWSFETILKAGLCALIPIVLSWRSCPLYLVLRCTLFPNEYCEDFISWSIAQILCLLPPHAPSQHWLLHPGKKNFYRFISYLLNYFDFINTAVLHHTSLVEVLLPSFSSARCSTSYFCLQTSIWPTSSWEVAL